MFSLMRVALASLQAAPTSAIPFRTESAVSSDRIVTAAVLMLLLVGGLVVALILANKKGWLAKWCHRGSSPQTEARAFAVRATRRVSAFTTVHVLAHGDKEFLLVESTRGASAQLHALPSQADRAEGLL